jgi:hypothetical protein
LLHISTITRKIEILEKCAFGNEGGNLPYLSWAIVAISAVLVALSSGSLTFSIPSIIQPKVFTSEIETWEMSLDSPLI